MTYLSNQKIYKSEDLNEDLRNFKYGRIDRPNQVPDALFTANSTYKISATHLWSLARIFPIIMGEKLKNNDFFLDFLEILNIFRYLMGDSFNTTSLEKLKTQIDNYLKNFKKLYDEEKIIPKQHFLIHYPSIVRKFGPPKLYWTMRFEAKHSYFKRVDTATHNHVNLLF